MKKVWRSIAFGAVLAVAGTAVPSLTAMPFAGVQDQGRDHDRDHDQAQYANNPYYQMGTREGSKDHDKNKRKKHHHKYKNDQDRQAYEQGYEQSWQGQHGSHDNDRPHP